MLCRRIIILQWKKQELVALVLEHRFLFAFYVVFLLIKQQYVRLKTTRYFGGG